LRDKKLIGAIKIIGITFANFGSTPVKISTFNINVPTDQKITRFRKYLTPDL
jgi:hypothetical protein